MSKADEAKRVPDDKEIVELFFARDERAIDATMRKYEKLLLSLSARITGSEEDAKECVNDVCLRLWNSIPPEKPNSVQAYAAKITRNLSIDRLKSETAEKRGGGVLLEELDESLPDTDSDLPEENTLGGLIDAFLRQVNSDARRMFILRYYFGRDFSEIAKSLACSEGKVTSQLQRTRKKLKEYLEKEGVSV